MAYVTLAGWAGNDLVHLPRGEGMFAAWVMGVVANVAVLVGYR